MSRGTVVFVKQLIHTQAHTESHDRTVKHKHNHAYHQCIVIDYNLASRSRGFAKGEGGESCVLLKRKKAESEA